MNIIRILYRTFSLSLLESARVDLESTSKDWSFLGQDIRLLTKSHLCIACDCGISLCVCVLAVCLSVCLSDCLSVCLSIYLSIYLSVY